MATTTVKAWDNGSDWRFKTFRHPKKSSRERRCKIDITYCGVCHSDIHTARNEWHGSTYPVVPGHEIVGRVLEVGDNVSSYKAGDLVGVGCVDSCQTCSPCQQDLEQFCEAGATFTYNSPTNISKENKPTEVPFSSCWWEICITHTRKYRWSRRHLYYVQNHLVTIKSLEVKAGDKVGVVGLGGLGHMGVKFAL
jgi:uncharacterized zinc-type alcohol dehydrogenase-like protein